MDTKNMKEQDTIDLQTEDTSNNKKKETTNKKAPAKKATKTKEAKTDANKTTTKKPATKKTTTKKKTTKSSEQKTEEKKPLKKANREITKKKAANKSKQKIVEEEIQNEKVLVQDIKETPVEVENKPIVEDIKRFKLFFVSDMDDEASYLHDMSLQGYHFVTKKGMQYVFRQGEPKNFYYHLGYYEKDKKDGDRYVDNYLDAGWEKIYHEKAEFDGVWNYFRIEMEINEPEPNIFSDRVSRLALYKRLLSSWRSLLAVDVICFLALLYICYSLSTHPSTMTNLFMAGCIVLLIIIILVFVIYLRAYFKISKKQEELLNI